ncbi:MAG TPA: lysophospholipid acyltransferase family protein [Acidimicrobiales bacterium]|nr:lysophospholipid acyltransferase family protein [Acidimicrobiales bacterium]
MADLPRRLASLVPRPLAEVVETPRWPGTIERPAKADPLGVGYDTAWSRRPAARQARKALLEGVSFPLTHLLARPEVLGRERLDALPGPCLFVANHSSHLDTTILLSALPRRFRDRCVVAAAADTFFDRRWKAAVWSFTLASIPIERSRVNRASADLAAELLTEGWSVVLYPEGGRTRDGWGQQFHGGAAYLAKRSEAPVVPVHLHGVRPLLPKGGNRLRAGKVTVRFGSALRPYEAAAGELEVGGDARRGAPEPGLLPERGRAGGLGGAGAGGGAGGRGGAGGAGGGRGEDARRFAVRIEQAVAELADEAETDWWTARRRAAKHETPSLQGPAVSPWRRAWELPESRRAEPTSSRRRMHGEPRPWERRGR